MNFVRLTGGSSGAHATYSGTPLTHNKKQQFSTYFHKSEKNLLTRNQELFPGELVTTLYKVSAKNLKNPKADENAISC